MSRAMGRAVFADKTVLYFVHNGTSDSSFSSLWTEGDEAWKCYGRCYHGSGNWDELNPQCTCGEPPETVILTNDYGSGTTVNGTACRHCMAIIDDGYDW